MLYPYRYAGQFERYIEQFMRVFSGFQVRDGVNRNSETDPLAEATTKRVPVVYGAMDRVVASVLQDRDSFKANRIPLMAVNLTSIEPNPDAKKPPYHVDEIVYKNKDGEKKGIHRIIGPAFLLRFEVSIYASSTTELMSILEQILLIFNPRIAIQLDTNLMNSDYITEITLDSTASEIQYPMGTQHQVVMYNLNFTVPTRLRYPYDPNGAYIEEIKANILAETKGAVEDILIGTIDVIGEDE